MSPSQFLKLQIVQTAQILSRESLGDQLQPQDSELSLVPPMLLLQGSQWQRTMMMRKLNSNDLYYLSSFHAIFTLIMTIRLEDLNGPLRQPLSISQPFAISHSCPRRMIIFAINANPSYFGTGSIETIFSHNLSNSFKKIVFSLEGSHNVWQCIFSFPVTSFDKSDHTS